MNGFALHKIQHSSPSALNMWAAAPCAFIAKYLLGAKFKFGLAPKAGMIVEAAVSQVLSDGWTEEKAIENAIAEYNLACAFGASDADMKRGEAIPGMITGAIAELKQYGEPEQGTDLLYGKKQKKVEMVCNGDGFKLPVIGYLDFHFPKHGLIVDLKTSMKIPSEMSDEHLRQGAFYRSAMGNSAVKFLYCTGKKTIWHEVNNPEPVMAEFKTLLNRQEKFLRIGDVEKLKDVVPVNCSSFYWKDDEQLRKSLYGL